MKTNQISLREAAQMALEALEYAEQHHGGDDCYADSIKALRSALDNSAKLSAWADVTDWW